MQNVNEMKTVTEKRYGEYSENDVSVTLRSNSASAGGGSEVLIICSIKKQSEHCVQTITKAQTGSMSNKIN